MATDLHDARRPRARRRLAATARAHARLVEELAQEGAAALWEEWRRALRGPVRRYLEGLDWHGLLGVQERAIPGPGLGLTLPDELLQLGERGIVAAISAMRKRLQEALAGLDAFGVPLYDLAEGYLEAGLREAARRTWFGLIDPNRLAQAVSEALKDGLGLQGAIARVIDHTARRYYQAERLVRTELSSALNRTRMGAYAQAGAVGMRWITAQDSRVRGMRPHDKANHVKMHGVEVKIGEPFITSLGSVMEYPGDRRYGAKPEDVINCRCTIIPVWPEEAPPPSQPAPRPTSPRGPEEGDRLRIDGVRPSEDWGRWYSAYKALKAEGHLPFTQDDILPLADELARAYAQAMAEFAASHPLKEARTTLQNALREIALGQRDSFPSNIGVDQTYVLAVLAKGRQEARAAQTGEVMADLLDLIAPLKPISAPRNIERRPEHHRAWSWVMRFAPEGKPPPEVEFKKGRAAYSIWRNRIRMETADPPIVLVHELGHWLEIATGSVRESAEWVLARGVSPPVGLSTLTGNDNYRLDEIALRGDFWSLYIGRVYMAGSSGVGYQDPSRWHATEVVSMGLQGLYAWVSGESPWYTDHAFALDRRHLRYILSLLMRGRR